MLKVPMSTDGYELAVEFIGYTRHTCTINANKSNIILSTIVLNEDTIALEEATVTAKEATQNSTVEHTTINVTANLASDKGTAIDILRSASSVTISNDEISIRGNTSILVLMDGIPTTANDLSTIPAGNIKSIEVITNPDASNDASGTGGIINIVSKKNSLEGFSGMISASYGFNHFVTANAAISYNKSKASYRFNYNTKYEDDDVFNTAKWEVSSRNNIFNLTNISHNKSRMFWLGVSYNFNSFKQKSSQKNEADRGLIRLICAQRFSVGHFWSPL